MDIILLDPLGNGKKYLGHKHLLRDWTGGSIPGFLSCPPLELMYAASYLRKYGFQAEIIEANIKHMLHRDIIQILKQKRPKFVLVPTTYLSLDDDRYLASLIRNSLQDVKIIFSGSLVTHDPKLVLDGYTADFVALGELELPLLNLLKGESFSNIAYRDENGQIVLGQRELIDVADVPIPARDMINNNLYRYAIFNRANPVTAMSISRGCVHSKCSFCHCNIFTLGEIRFRNIDDILNEIDQIVNRYNIGEIFFRDQVFTADKDLVYRICEYIIENRINVFWRATTRVDCVDEKLLKKMKQAGCYQISFGLETNSQEALDYNNKGIKVQDSYQAVNWAKNAGLEVLGLFIYGLPPQTKQSMGQILPFAFDLKVDYAIFNSIYLAPGVPIYERYKNGEVEILEHKLLKKFVRNAYIGFYFRPKYFFGKLRKIRTFNDVSFAFKAFADEFISQF